jgi:alpha/beta superfamily hydrolase
MVGLKVGVEDPRVVALLALGTAIHVYDYSYLAGIRKPVLVVQGEHDEHGTAAEVEEIFSGFGDHVTVQAVPGAGHLFEGHLEELQSSIREFFAHGAGAKALDDARAKTGRRLG